MIRLKTLLNENVKDASFINRLKKYENSKGNQYGGWNKQKQRWFPHNSPEGGMPTIAYGHKMKSKNEFPNGLTDQEATTLLNADIDRAINKIKTQLKITDFDQLPVNVQQALVNATFRGELKADHEAVKQMRAGNWHNVADLYLARKDYRNGSSGLKDRMNWNAHQFRIYGEKLQLQSINKNDIRVVNPTVKPNQEVTIQIINQEILPIDSIKLRVYSVSGTKIKEHSWQNVKRGILQFPAPKAPGSYLLNINQSATLPLTVTTI